METDSTILKNLPNGKLSVNVVCPYHLTSTPQAVTVELITYNYQLMANALFVFASASISVIVMLCVVMVTSLSSNV